MQLLHELLVLPNFKAMDAQRYKVGFCFATRSKQHLGQESDTYFLATNVQPSSTA